jgi:predicted RND superfamily exporter protein
MKTLRVLGLLAVVALTVLAAFGARRIEFDTSMEVWFLEKDPDVRAYHDFLEIFESDQIIAMAGEDPALFTPEGLAFLDKYSKRALQVEHVIEARSITSMTQAQAEPGVIRVVPLYEPEDPPSPEMLKARVMADPLIRGRLISDDGRVPAIVLTVDPLTARSEEKLVIAAALREIGREMKAERGVSPALAGPTMLDDAFFRYTQRDLRTNFPLILAVIVVVVLALFRTPWALLLPSCVILLSCLWVSGIMGWFNVRITIIHTIIFPMLLGMGVANSMHILSKTTIYRAEGLDRYQAGLKALKNMLVPCLMTAIMSAAGLISLYTAVLKPLRELGILGAIGTMSAFGLTFVLGPFLLPFLPITAAHPDLEGGSQTSSSVWRRWDAALVGLARWVQARPGKVLALGLALMAAALLGLTQLSMGINALNYFRNHDPVRTDVVFVDEHLAGTLTIEVMIDAGKPDGIKDPEVLKKMKEIQDFLKGVHGVGATLSVVDYLSELRRVTHGGAEEERRLPDTRREAAQLLLLLDDPREIERLVDFDWQRARISGTIHATLIPELVDGLEPLEPMVNRLFPPPAHGIATGQTKLVRNMERYLLGSQVRSLGSAFLAVALLMILALRSWRLGVFAMIPNVVPIAVVLGIMGWSGIQLDPGTAMTGAVAMGLVVDDTVHFLHHLKERLMAGDSVARATERTLVEAGRAAAMTAVILTSAFWVSCTASFKPNIYFGLLTGATILLAALAELILLPAALMLVPERLLRLRKPDAAAATA